jgi:predicted acetyltransferase
MVSRLEEHPARVEVVRALPEQESVLANLLELYAHDFSEFSPLEINDVGRFGYPRLPLYWTEPHRHPFLIKADNRLAGFIFVQQESQLNGDRNIWDVAEFFVLRGQRRRGVGIKAAHATWHRFSGSWEVRVMWHNPAAKEFWRAAVSEFTGQAADARLFESGGTRWHVFSFQSSGESLAG